MLPTAVQRASVSKGASARLPELAATNLHVEKRREPAAVRRTAWSRQTNEGSHNEAMAALEGQLQILRQAEVKPDATRDKQVSLADPDARSMKTRGAGLVGSNVQVAVDAKRHLIVAHQVTNDGIDRDLPLDSYAGRLSLLLYKEGPSRPLRYDRFR